MRLLLAFLCLSLSGCLVVSGTIGYTDPKTGATGGFTIGNAPKAVQAADEGAKQVVELER